jgi:hypothetical protein
MDGLVRPVDAALREHERVERAWRVAAADAAVGKVEAGSGEVEEAVVALRGGDQHRRRLAAGPAREPSLEGREALRVGRAGRQHLVVARDELELDALERTGVGERAGERADAVGPRNRGQAEIRDHEPLGRARVPRLRLGRVLRPRGHDVDPRREVRDGLGNGKGGHHVGVLPALHQQLARIDHRGAVALQLVERLAIELLLEVARSHGLGEAAVADAEEVDQDGVHIDGDDRHALLPGRGQHVVAAREAGGRRAVPHIDAELLRRRERLVDIGRQALADGELIGLAMLQPIDADLLGFRRHRRLLDALQLDVRRKIDPPLGEVFGELDAGARRRGVAVDRVVEDAEPAFGAQRRIGRAGVRIVGEGEARLQSVEGRAPRLAGREGVRQHGERARLGLRVRRDLIGPPGGPDRLFAQALLLRIVVGLDAGQGDREVAPGLLVPRILAGREREGDGRLTPARRADLRHALLDQLGDRAGVRDRLALQPRLELERALRGLPVGESAGRGLGRRGEDRRARRRGRGQHGGERRPSSETAPGQRHLTVSSQNPAARRATIILRAPERNGDCAFTPSQATA